MVADPATAARVPIRSKLKPGKVRSAVGRRWFEARMARVAVSGRGRPIELGSAYGGWIVPEELLEPGFTCYCVGAGGDISFDLELIARFDATVQAVEPDETYVSSARIAAAEADRFSIERAALAVVDGPLLMQRTHHPGSHSLSAADLYDTSEMVEIPGRSLASLASERGQSQIELLKIDVEGAEYDILPTLDLDALGVRILAVQLHHNRGVGAARRQIGELQQRGFELVAMRPVVKATFARRDLLA